MHGGEFEVPGPFLFTGAMLLCRVIAILRRHQKDSTPPNADTILKWDTRERYSGGVAGGRVLVHSRYSTSFELSLLRSKRCVQ